MQKDGIYAEINLHLMQYAVPIICPHVDLKVLEMLVASGIYKVWCLAISRSVVIM